LLGRLSVCTERGNGKTTARAEIASALPPILPPCIKCGADIFLKMLQIYIRAASG
jgi:hypothetical protein